MTTVCLNMIVKNEMANLERCLTSVAPAIDAWVIGDTGSTDGTQDFIRAFFAERAIPGELHEFPFENFEQARNQALHHAYASEIAFDYLLFDDADMELVIEDADYRARLDGPGYTLLQRSTGGLSYWNTRLVRRDLGALYHGVTHEYLDVPGGAAQLTALWYRDHASGSNRVDKFERDIRLLKKALKTDPDNVRYWFYLAQSHRDARQLKEAAAAYAKRAEMGGWAEEAWEARLQHARCLRDLKDEAGFVAGALAAFNQRPQRAEPLYDLARHYRLKGDNHTSAMFAERALAMAPPVGDILFVEDWAYGHGPREELSIAANYSPDPERKDRGFAACNALALDPTAAEKTRELARSNLDFYLRPAAEMMPSFEIRVARAKRRPLDGEPMTGAKTAPPIAVDNFRGGAQRIPFDGGALALIHETTDRDKVRRHRHRFVWFDPAARLAGVSRPFYFQQHAAEIPTGLAWDPDGQRLAITYNAGDNQSWQASVAAAEVRALIEDAHNLPAGEPDPKGVALLLREPSPLETDPSPPACPSPLAGKGGPPKEGRMRGDPPASKGSVRAIPTDAKSTAEFFHALAPFLGAVDSAADRREASKAFDAPVASLLDFANDAALPQIHCFYEVLKEGGRHDGLIAAMTSMRAAGHPVRVWTYSADKLDFLRPLGIELADAADVVPREFFERVMKRREIRYFSDVFRYAALYEHGGVWMDSDIILLRPFPFRGEHFFNLQWRSGPNDAHFVCGNVIAARRHSRHMRAFYETSIDRVFATDRWIFGDVGPMLISDYIASDAGAELRDQVFSPMFFNSIDWTEVDRFDSPLGEVAEHLHDERVFGMHLWTARNEAAARGEKTSLISLLSDPATSFPSFTDLADRFDTDKNRHTGNHHNYARIYDQLLSSRRLSLGRLMEIGASPGSRQFWQACFPFGEIVGPDEATGPLDVIVDNGSHASHDQQQSLRDLWPRLADGGWYFIESLDWQPPSEDRARSPLTKDLLREIQQAGVARLDPLGISDLSSEFAEILFFDSHYELTRAELLGGLVAIKKRGGSGLVR